MSGYDDFSGTRELPREVADEEDVGRAVFEESKAKELRKGKPQPRVFREKVGVFTLSVDRLSFNEHAEIAQIHDNLRQTKGQV